MMNRFPPVFPMPEAINYGEATYGLFQDFDLAGVWLRMRWVPPGEFWMGGPENEKGRYDDETHQYIEITKGFWLAETTVTQAFWQAIMGKKQGHFKGDTLPVDSVNWHDCQACIEALARINPQLDWRLPTEVEWEYACRAGTTTPFNFAGDISLEKVNYCGEWDSLNDAKGALQKTCDVKSFKPNPLGLYQMHGNVWEWCSTPWQEQASPQQHDSEISVDETLDEDIEYVVRGGSWFFSGRICRSAYRDCHHAGNRSRNIGFRLALGLELRRPAELGQE